MQKSTVQGDKSKTVAIILAIFLGAWSWLYTWKADAWKFWIFTLLSLLPAASVVYSLSDIYRLMFVLMFGLVILGALQLWPILDSIIKPSSFYLGYRSRGTSSQTSLKPFGVISLIFGLIWIAVYYLSAASLPIPTIGNGNILLGLILFIVGLTLIFKK